MFLYLSFSTLLLCHNYNLHVQDIVPSGMRDNSCKNKLTSQIFINQCLWISCKLGSMITHLEVKWRTIYENKKKLNSLMYIFLFLFQLLRAIMKNNSQWMMKYNQMWIKHISYHLQCILTIKLFGSIVFLFWVFIYV